MNTADTIVFFDFDGVIADSIDHAFNTSRQLEPHLTKKEFIARFNGNIMHHPAIKKWGEKFQAQYTDGVPNQMLFPGMREVVEKLANEHMLIIVSASITAGIYSFLARHSLAEHFSDVMGSDIHASKHVKMTNALQEHSVSADRAVMITDTLGDMHEAEQSSVTSIGVLWGFHDKETLAQGSAVALVESPAKLYAHVNTVLAPAG